MHYSHPTLANVIYVSVERDFVHEQFYWGSLDATNKIHMASMSVNNQCSPNILRYVFSKGLRIDASWLARKGEVWGVFCEFIFWTKDFFLSYCGQYRGMLDCEISWVYSFRRLLTWYKDQLALHTHTQRDIGLLLRFKSDLCSTAVSVVPQLLVRIIWPFNYHVMSCIL